MTALALTNETVDSIGFARLQALVQRGYKPLFGITRRDDGHVCIPLVHPRATRKDPPPPLMLWSDGIVSTSAILWPQKYVPSDDAPPDWQKYILPGEADRFESFALSVTPPDVIDLYVKPFCAEAKLFVLRMIFGATLCTVLGITAYLTLAHI